MKIGIHSMVLVVFGWPSIFGNWHRMKHLQLQAPAKITLTPPALALCLRHWLAAIYSRSVCWPESVVSSWLKMDTHTSSHTQHHLLEDCDGRYWLVLQYSCTCVSFLALEVINKRAARVMRLIGVELLKKCVVFHYLALCCETGPAVNPDETYSETLLRGVYRCRRYNADLCMLLRWQHWISSNPWSAL